LNPSRGKRFSFLQATDRLESKNASKEITTFIFKVIPKLLIRVVKILKMKAEILQKDCFFLSVYKALCQSTRHYVSPLGIIYQSTRLYIKKAVESRNHGYNKRLPDGRHVIYRRLKNKRNPRRTTAHTSCTALRDPEFVFHGQLFSKRLWSPRSPGLNPHDFSV